MSEGLVEKLKTHESFKDLPPKEWVRIAHVVDLLRQVRLFESLSDLDLAAVAEKGVFKHYECGDIIIHEGDTDKTFYVILKGQVRVWSKDGNGSAHLLNYHEAGDFFGELAPLNGSPRAANVDVINDVDLIAFEEEGFQRIVQHHQISQYMRSWGQERIQLSNRSFDGKHWDEISIVLAHKSWFALLRVIFFPIMIVLLTLTISGLLWRFSDVSEEILVSIAIAITVGMALWILWMWEDWRNDDLIVTSKRIIHIERVLVPPFPVERHEAFVDQVQDVTTLNLGIWTWLFRVKTLEIKTAGAGIIQFPYLQDTAHISDEIFRARELANIRKTGEERSQIRLHLLTELDRPAKTVMSLESGEQVPVTPERTGLLKVLDYFVPRARIVQRDQIIWRRHWIVLLQAVLPAVFLFLFFGVLFVLSLIRPSFLRGIPLYLTFPLPAGGMLAACGWYLWRYDGWRNDVYIVTDSRIVDIEGSPFHLQEERRTEGTFDVIQNTDYSSPNWFYRLLRVGDVTIDTAAEQRAFTFDSVPHPDEVQQEIFKRLTAYRENQAQEEREQQYREFTKWFGTYHRSVIEQKE